MSSCHNKLSSITVMLHGWKPSLTMKSETKIKLWKHALLQPTDEVKCEGRDIFQSLKWNPIVKVIESGNDKVCQEQNSTTPQISQISFTFSPQHVNTLIDMWNKVIASKH